MEPRPSRVWSGGFGLRRHHSGLARVQQLASTAIPCLRRRCCPDLRRRRHSVPSHRESGRGRPCGGFILSLPCCACQQIFAKPRIYNSWGNYFEQFSLVTGAAIVYAPLSSAWSPEMLNRLGRILFGLCTVSFTLEQAIYLHATASLVPKWLPPNQMFWAVARLFSSHSRLWLFSRIDWRFSPLAC